MGGTIRKFSGSFFGGDAAEKGAKRSADASIAGQREALDYLKETEAQPQFYKEQALGGLSSYYGLPEYDGRQRVSDEYDAFGKKIKDLQSQYDYQASIGGSRSRKARRGLQRQIDEQQRQQGLLDYDPNAPLEGEYLPAGNQGQQDFITDVEQSPFYQSMVDEGEQAIGRNVSMTGGLRSGTANEALAQNSQQVLQGLVSERLRGLQGMASLPSNAGQIASGIRGIGTTAAQGIAAGAQAQQDAIGGFHDVGKTALAAYMGSKSDPRLKDNIVKVDEVDGVNIYSWTWNDDAKQFGLTGGSVGVMATEIKESHPEFVYEEDGYLAVDYPGLNKKLH